MRRKYLMINAVLIVCAVAVTLELQHDWKAWEQEHNLPAIRAKVKTGAPEIKLPEAPAGWKAPAAAEMAYISDNNLFHSDRNMTIAAPEGPPPAEKPPELRVKPVVVGIITFDGVPAVQVQSPGKDDGPRTMMLSVGDSWEEIWKVEQILEDKMILLAKDTREEISYYESARTGSAGPKRNPAPQPARMANNQQVINIGAAAPSAAPQTASSQQAATAAPPPPAAPRVVQSNNAIRPSAGTDASGRRSGFQSMFRPRGNTTISPSTTRQNSTGNTNRR